MEAAGESIIERQKPTKVKASTIGFLKFHGFGMQQIVPRLFLGGQDVAASFPMLKEKCISHILNLTTNIENNFESEFTYKRIRVNDSLSEDLFKYFKESFEFIEKALLNPSHAVLVHCNAGVSRSASIVIAYLMQKRLFSSYQAALSYVKSCRSVIEPNSNFSQQLVCLESKLLANTPI